MQWFIIGSVVVVVVAGAFVAAWWWRLVAKIAPYKDELTRQDHPADDHVVVISRAHASSPGHTQPPRGES